MSGEAIITLSVSGEPIGEQVRFIAEGVSDFSTYFPRLKPAWLESRRDVIESQGWALNRPWPTYDETDEQYAYRWYKEGVLGHPVTPGDILRWDAPGIDERLAPSLMDGKHKENVFEVSKVEAEMGTMVPYARFIDSGQGPAGPDFFPLNQQFDPIKRDIIAPTEDFRQAIQREASGWLGELADSRRKVKVRVSTRDVLAAMSSS